MEDFFVFMLIASIMVTRIIYEARKQKKAQVQSVPKQIVTGGHHHPKRNVQGTVDRPRKPQTEAIISEAQLQTQTEILTDDSSLQAGTPPVDIHSVEDIRKAVIWSEILNRKY